MYYPKNIAAVYTSHAPDLPAPQALKHKDAWLKYQIAKITGARFPWLSFGYTSSDFGAAEMTIADAEDESARRARARLSERPPLGQQEDIELGGQPAPLDASNPAQEHGFRTTNVLEWYASRENVQTISTARSPSRFPIAAVAQRPQTLAYGLCDSPAGLLALVFDALRPTIPPSIATTLQPPQAGKHRRSATIIQRPNPTLPTRASPYSNAFTPADVLNWTMMYWLPGPEASLRWLLVAEKEDCYAEYSEVPLGISWHTSSTTKSQSFGQVIQENPSVERNRSSSKSSARKSSSTPPTPASPANIDSGSPMWASAVQNLKWVKRRRGVLESGVPAWEASADVIQDIREFFETGRNEGWLGL
jgi:hypothetical protein